MAQPLPNLMCPLITVRIDPDSAHGILFRPDAEFARMARFPGRVRIPTGDGRRTSRTCEGEMVEGVSVPVAVTTSRSEADLIVGLLQSYGLDAAVSADDAGGQEPQLQLQGVRVLVAPSDESEARRILATAEDTTA